MKKEKNIRRQFLPRAINLLVGEEKPLVLEKITRMARVMALFFLIAFLLTALFTFLQSWFLTSLGASLERRADEAKRKILSFKEEEKTYLALTQKLKNAEEILHSRASLSRFLKEAELLLPSGILPHLATFKETGEVDLVLSSSSLSEIENLNENLKKAIKERKVLSVKIGSVTKEEDLYKLTLSLEMVSSTD